MASDDNSNIAMLLVDVWLPINVHMTAKRGGFFWQMFFLALPVHPGPWDRPSHRWPQASNPSRSLGKKSANHDLTATDPKAADCWASSLQVRPWHRQVVGQGSMDCTCRSSYRIPNLVGLDHQGPMDVYGFVRDVHHTQRSEKIVQCWSC